MRLLVDDASRGTALLVDDGDHHDDNDDRDRDRNRDRDRDRDRRHGSAVSLRVVVTWRALLRRVARGLARACALGGVACVLLVADAAARACGVLAALYVAWLVVVVAALGVRCESALAVGALGIALETTHWCGWRRRRFVDAADIDAVVIVEACARFQVVHYVRVGARDHAQAK
jgi:hypothetical protein